MKGRLKRSLVCASGALFLSPVLPATPDLEQLHIAEMIRVEEAIMALTPELNILNRKAGNLLIDFPKIRVPHLVPTTVRETPPSRITSWQTAGKANTTPLAAVLSQAERLPETRFYLIDGSFTPEGHFQAKTGFEASGLHQSGQTLSITSTQTLTWSGKTLIAWSQGKVQSAVTAKPFFHETLDECLPATDSYLRARESMQEQNIIKLFTQDKFTVSKPLYAEYLDLDSTFQHPGLSVADVNNDGLDDLYVMGRWGQNQLLIAQEDGTFRDEAVRRGLALNGLCTSAIFADFDNDGDSDVFIGRSLERSRYFKNQEGVFQDATQEAFKNIALPYLVSTVSAVDYDGDGLLDLYLGLYAPPQQKHGVEKWARRFFPPGMAKAIIQKAVGSHPYLHRIGPPNLLLKNIGNGRFSIAPEASDLAEWHDTHQATWCDFDQDGDPDVYVCNDFAPDHLYENTGLPAPGKPRFKDISIPEMQGFGMGASWGDYDRDGRFDLYVSNMYSKAGLRITDTIDGLDPRALLSARGSLMFRQTAKGFIENGTALGVHKVGWSYGGLFLDFNNDGWQDLYASSGFYSAPKEIETERDL